MRSTKLTSVSNSRPRYMQFDSNRKLHSQQSAGGSLFDCFTCTSIDRASSWEIDWKGEPYISERLWRWTWLTLSWVWGVTDQADEILNTRPRLRYKYRSWDKLSSWHQGHTFASTFKELPSNSLIYPRPQHNTFTLAATFLDPNP